MAGVGRRARGIFTDDCPVLGDEPVKVAVLPGVVHIETTAQHSDCLSAAGDGPCVADGVNADCKSADHHRPGPGQVAGESFSHPLAIFGKIAGAHHSDGQLL